MPQLNPSPWFLIMLMVWTILMTLFFNKTLTMLYPNTPTEPTSEDSTKPSWTWPWY
uniref:ATP synthase complex subunit 8 n=1 Tax=Urosaurus graciosus TaxID=43647 RepID=B2X855_9SAUR|nr:ATPase 8 [Urosaurus graciosus]ABY73858.1 ATPase 8 [Urosaurus graciosus]